MTKLFPHLLFICLWIYSRLISNLHSRSQLPTSQLLPRWVGHTLRTWAEPCLAVTHFWVIWEQVGLSLKKQGLAWNHFHGKNKSQLSWPQWHLTEKEVDPIIKRVHSKCEAAERQLVHPRKISPLFVARHSKKNKQQTNITLCSLCKCDISLPPTGTPPTNASVPSAAHRMRSSWDQFLRNLHCSSILPAALTHFLSPKYQTRTSSTPRQTAQAIWCAAFSQCMRRRGWGTGLTFIEACWCQALCQALNIPHIIAAQESNQLAAS